MSTPITRAGYLKLENELSDRIKIKRPRIIAAIDEARGHGDLSENAEYHAAKEEQSHNEGRIAQIQNILSNVHIVDNSNLTDSTVRFGAYVRVVNEDTDEEFCYQIVSEHESDIDLFKISMTSPLGKSLLNKSVGDTATVRAPIGKKYYEIIAVDYAE